jgi:AsmA protein
MKRKIMLVTGGLAVGAFALCGAVLLLVDADSFRPAIQTELQRQLHRPVTLGKLSVSLWPLGLRADDVRVGERPGVPDSGRPFVRMQSLQVRAGLLALLRRQIHVESLVLQRPEIELVKLPSGEWNYSDLTRSSGGGGSASAALTELRVEDGAIGVTTSGRRSVYDHVRLALHDVGPGLSTAIEASLQVPGSGAEALSFNGRLNPLAGKLVAKQISVAGLARATGASAAPVDGSLSGNVDVTPSSASGHIEMQNAVVRGKPLRAPAVLDFTVAIDGNRVDVRKLQLSSGKMTATGSGWLDTAKSTVDLTARMAETSLTELLEFAGMDGSGTVSVELTARGPLAGDLEVSGRGSLRNAELRDPSLKAPLRVASANFTFDRNDVELQNVNGSFAGSAIKGSLAAKSIRSTVPGVEFDIEADKVDSAEWQSAVNPASGSSSGGSAPKLRGRGALRIGRLLAQGIAMENVRAEAALDNGVLTLDPLTADLFGGKQTGRIAVDTRPKVPALAIRTKLDNVDANKLLSATTSMKQLLHGLLLAGGDAKLSLASSPEEIARSLNGALNLRLTKGRLTGTHVLNQLATIGRFVGYNPASQPFTDILQLDGDVKVTDGVARTDNLRMQIQGAAVSLAGVVNLVDQGVDLKLTAVLDRATSQKVGGTGIGGFLNTALANPQGELIIPALVTGTLAKPKFTPDAGRMVELKARGLMNTLTSKPAGQGVRGLIDAFRKK